MRIEDPDNLVDKFTEKIPNKASITLDELLTRMEKERMNEGPIKKYFRSKGAFGYNLWYLIWHPWIIISEVWEEIEMAWQRAIKGWDDRQTWSVDYYYSKILSELLSKYKEVNNGVPANVIMDVCGKDYEFGSESQEQFKKASELWDSILTEMIDGFAYYYDHKKNYYEHENYDLVEKKIKRSLELFSKYFENLWW